MCLIAHFQNEIYQNVKLVKLSHNSLYSCNVNVISLFCFRGKNVCIVYVNCVLYFVTGCLEIHVCKGDSKSGRQQLNGITD